ncbi:hypothetical protein ACIQVO_29860 [Streptomyces sp. NPDC101062]|uniref:hypothetical protein n=1 Tax=unclassified Streptomyces TaxID=2593676 RepID=UPI0037F9AC86
MLGSRPPSWSTAADAGFKAAVVEHGTLVPHRRLMCDHESRLASSGAWIHWSMTDVVLHRLTRTHTLIWRGPRARHRAPPTGGGCPVRHLPDRIETRQRLVRETAGQPREQIALLAE